MMLATKPVFNVLEREESLEILSRNHVGRIAYARANRVDIEPVHYVYSDGWIVGRTSRGSKIDTTGYSWWPVAFEVDEIEGLFRWRSVIVHGGLYAMPETRPNWSVPEWETAVRLLRTIIPETFTADDPVPFRTVLFRIATQEISGREVDSEPLPEGLAQTAGAG